MWNRVKICIQIAQNSIFTCVNVQLYTQHSLDTE